MARELLGTLTETLVVGAVEIERECGHVTRATPKTGGQSFVRLHLKDGGTYRYGGDPMTFDFDTADLDPETGNWIPE